ncbi:MAG: aspartate aminotransferase family protein [Methanomassiliicoccales archaeon]|nr:aspartate aminotransferase family protein [Methanomassiliicoccales archaeon]
MAKDPFVKLNLKGTPKVGQIVPGPKSAALLAEQRNYDSNALVYPNQVPLAIARGLGATVEDLDGNKFIDFSGGVGALNVGHSNPDVVEAIKAQAEEFTHGLDFPSKARVALSRKLVQLAPGTLKNNSKVLMCGPTGADAVEAAIKLAKFTSKKAGIISFEGGWHGVSGVSLSLTAKRAAKANYLPGVPEVYFAPYPYCYRCPFGMKHPDCGLACAHYLEHLIKDPDTGLAAPGAILIEPIQGEGGIVVPPAGYIAEVRRICDQHALLMIADEIQTGFCRTGAMFAMENEKITPDIMTVSKSMGSGLPISGIVFRKDLDTWGPGAHVGTFRGNALSCAAGVAGIEFMQEHRLEERSARLGKIVLDRLKALQSRYDAVGEVRGRGLYVGVELVKNDTAHSPDADLLARLQKECFPKGLIVWKGGRSGNVARVMPALVITEELLDAGLTIFEEGLKAVMVK